MRPAVRLLVGVVVVTAALALAVSAAPDLLPRQVPPATPAPRTDVVSRRPGTVTVLVNGLAARQLERGGTLVLVAGENGLPFLPWHLEVRDTGGAPLGALDLTGMPPMVLVTPGNVQRSLTEGGTFDPATDCGTP